MAPEFPSTRVGLDSLRLSLRLVESVGYEHVFRGARFRCVAPVVMTCAEPRHSRAHVRNAAVRFGRQRHAQFTGRCVRLLSHCLACSCLWAQWRAPHMRWSLDCSSRTARLFNVGILRLEQSDLMPKRSVRPSQETKVPQITALSRASLKISQSCGLRAHRSCRRRRQSRHCCR